MLIRLVAADGLLTLGRARIILAGSRVTVGLRDSSARIDFGEWGEWRRG